jgi:hypothetical protein
MSDIMRKVIHKPRQEVLSELDHADALISEFEPPGL